MESACVAVHAVQQGIMLRGGDGLVGVGLNVWGSMVGDMACVRAAEVWSFCMFVCVLCVLCCVCIHVSCGLECWHVSKACANG